MEDVKTLSEPFTFPCGVSAPNRIAKGAMTESLADARTNKPNESLYRLYSRWAEGGLGLSITGNVAVDRKHREAARNVCCEPMLDEAADFKLYAEAVKGRDRKCVAIVQLTHAGRQTTPAVNRTGLLSASDVRVQLPNGAPSWIFGTPRAMTLTEIRDVQERFAYAAGVMEHAGFDGIELHAAHGYLISQFLSPLANHRTDEYGGSAENRRRMLLEIVRAVRARTSARFVVGVKLNSADFQRGGFSEEDSLDVVRALAQERVDFVEVSGGTYESHAMMDGAGALVEMRESTRRREAYFLDFARAARRAAPALPLIVTGGFRSRSAMAAAVREGACDLVGLARPLCLDPALPARLAGPAAAAAAAAGEAEARAPAAWIDGRAGLEALSSFWHTRQLWEMAAGREPRPRMGWLYSQTVQAARHLFLEPAITPPLSWLWDLLWPVRRPALPIPAPAAPAARGKVE